MPFIKGGIDYDYLAPVAGIASTGSNTTLKDESLDMATDIFQNGRIYIYKLITGKRYLRNISSNTSNEFTFDPLPAGVYVIQGDEYKIEG